MAIAGVRFVPYKYSKRGMNKTAMFLAGITGGELTTARNTLQRSRHVPQKDSVSFARI